VKILIVDDEKIVSNFFAQLAKVRGYTDIDTVSSGEDAMAYVIRNSYSLITLDIQMPGVSGLEIIAMLRNMCPHAIIAIISGFIPEEISTEVAGCADVMIPKPINIETFNQLLDSAEQIEKAVEQARSVGIDPAIHSSN
jgi:CheY-like chemotaxis protein